MTWSVAIVGSGIIGRNHAAAISRLPELRIDAVVDPVAEANAALAALCPGEPGQYASLPDALAQSDPDLVVICTPSGLHADAAELALAAGKHVAIEKPVDVSLPKARRLAALAEEAEARGQLCAVFSQHRFDPASVAVAEAVHSGRFGALTSAVATVPWWRAQAYYDSAAWRGTWELDGGVVLNQGVHAVDLLLWLLGTPTQVFAFADRLAHERLEAEDVAAATIRFASGALATLHATTAAHPGLAQRIQIHGTLGSAVLQDDQLAAFHVDGDPADVSAQVVPAEELAGAAKPSDAFVVGHLRQYQDIVAALHAGRPSGIGVREGLNALALVQSIYLSAVLGQPIAVAGVLDGAYDSVPLVLSSRSS